MKIRELIDELMQYDANAEVFAALFLADGTGEISEIESTCPNGPYVQINISSVAVAAGMGRRGGASRSAAKQSASRTNGAKGGRPRKGSKIKDWYQD